MPVTARTCSRFITALATRRRWPVAAPVTACPSAVAFFQDARECRVYAVPMLGASLIGLLVAGAAQVRPAITDVAWIAGCWELTRNGRHVVEQWTAPEGGSMLGLSRTVDGGRT